MTSKVRLDELKAALEKRHPSGGKELSEADYKRRLIAEINRLPGGRARRLEDRYAVGVLDMIIKLPDTPMLWAEGKIIHGNLFAPTEAQFEEGTKWLNTGVIVSLIGWKHGQMHVSPWIKQADIRECFTNPDVSYAQALWEYFH